ncbi:hypothetical protein FMM68_03895 [Lachnospiraceae bacterium MD329]|nr:hypothetical protein [Lachnospiraceae bacterium MD329]
MKKSVLLSIKPKHCELIANGRKTLEISKNRPKIDVPFKVYIYCTKNGLKIYGDGKCYVTDNFNLLNEKAEKGFEKTSKMRKWNCKVIGEFVCDWINCINPLEPDGVYYLLDSCMDAVDFIDYSGGKMIYAWHISDLVIYDKPKELSEFKGHNSECMWRFIRENGCKDADGNACRDCHLHRPPQSWCYVEESEE